MAGVEIGVGTGIALEHVDSGAQHGQPCGWITAELGQCVGLDDHDHSGGPDTGRDRLHPALVPRRGVRAPGGKPAAVPAGDVVGDEDRHAPGGTGVGDHLADGGGDVPAPLTQPGRRRHPRQLRQQGGVGG